jgi:hypothetical protein
MTGAYAGLIWILRARTQKHTQPQAQKNAVHTSTCALIWQGGRPQDRHADHQARTNRRYRYPSRCGVEAGNRCTEPSDIHTFTSFYRLPGVSKGRLLAATFHTAYIHIAPLTMEIRRIREQRRSDTHLSKLTDQRNVPSRMTQSHTFTSFPPDSHTFASSTVTHFLQRTIF